MLTLWLVIIFALVLQLVCAVLGRHSPTPANINTWLSMGGTIILLLSCALCAEEKGYSHNYGLLALLSIFGIIMLAILPHRNKDHL